MKLPEKVDGTKVIEILKRKKEDIDCTEDESAELKGYLRDVSKRNGIKCILNLEIENDSVSDEIEELFPLEYGEFIDEIF